MKKFLIRVSTVITFSAISGVVFTLAQWFTFKLTKRYEKRDRLERIRKDREANIKYYGQRRVDFHHRSNTPHHN